MNALEIIVGILLLIVCLIIIFATLLQEPKKGGLGSSFGDNNNSYYGKNSGRTVEAVLARLTKIAGVAFLVVTLLVCIISTYAK